MTCNHCHTWNFRDYKYCRHCGTKLEALVGAAEDPQEAEEVERLLSQAFAHLDQGNLEEATAAVQAALALQPGSPSAHSVLGGIYERQGQLEEAIQQYEFAVQLNPESQADLEKLAALRPPAGAAPPRRINVTQVAVIAAATAGVAVFVTGVALLLNPELRAPRRDVTPSGGAASDLSAPTLRPAYAGPTASLVAPPVTSAAGPAPSPFVNTPVPTPSRAAPSPLTIRSGPSYPNPLPAATPPAAPGAPQASSGLAAAAIGEVVPLVQPGGPAAGGAPVPGSGAGPVPAAQGGGQPASPGVPQQPGLAVQPTTQAENQGAGRKTGTGELSEQPPGFIKIEVLNQPAGSSSPDAPRPPTRRNGAPSIKVEIGGQG